MSTMGRIYTKNFEELKKNGNLSLIISVISLIFSIFALLLK